MRKYFLKDNVTQQDLIDNGFKVINDPVTGYHWAFTDKYGEDDLFIPLSDEAAVQSTSGLNARQIGWNRMVKKDKLDNKIFKLINPKLVKIVEDDLNDDQMEYIRDNHEEVLDEVIDEEIESQTMYNDDVWDILRERYQPFALLDGLVTREDLYEQLRSELYDDEEMYKEVYDRLNEDQQQEIDKLAY